MADSKTPGTDLPVGADPRRVAACVSACQGIPTEALESGIILKLIAALVHLKEPRIQDILESLSTIPPKPASKSPRRPTP